LETVKERKKSEIDEKQQCLDENWVVRGQSEIMKLKELKQQNSENYS